MRDTLKEFEDLNCKVFGISTDSPFALDAWAREQGYQFPLLSDYNKDVSRAYDCLYEELLGFKGKLKWAQDENGLTVQMLEQKPCEHAIALKIAL